jgi:hypothetical protein
MKRASQSEVEPTGGKMIGTIVKSPLGIGIVKLINAVSIIVQYEDGFERHDIENLKPLAPDELLNYWLDRVFRVIKTCSGIRYSELNAILPDCHNLETYINLLQRRELIGDIDSCYSILNLKLLNFIRRLRGMDGFQGPISFVVNNSMILQSRISTSSCNYF